MAAHTRNSEKTRRLIIDALGRILTERGFTGVGINAVAREAGVDKVLIYRYFGSMEGLLKAFKDSKKLFPGVVDVLDEFPEGTPLSTLAARLLIKNGKAFRENTLAQEIARWELTEKNPLTVAFSRSIERNELNSLEERGITPDRDTLTAVALLLSGLYYLILRQSIKNPILGIDLSNPEEEERVERVVSKLVNRYFAEMERLPCEC